MTDDSNQLAGGSGQRAAGGRRSEVRDQKSEIRGQKSESIMYNVTYCSSFTVHDLEDFL